MREKVPAPQSDGLVALLLPCQQCAGELKVSAMGEDVRRWKEGHSPKMVLQYVSEEAMELLTTDRCVTCNTGERFNGSNRYAY